MENERLLTQDEEDSLANIIRSARDIQKFLWGKMNEDIGLEEWRRMFRKRMAKLEAIDVSNPYAIIELKKRVLQLGALSVGLLASLEKEGTLQEFKPNEPISNLPQYAKSYTTGLADMLTVVIKDLEELRSPIDAHQEDMSIAWRAGDIILDQVYWEALKEKWHEVK